VGVEATTSYDLLPYSSKPYAQTHPDNLATVASLAGLRPPALEHCRVLELGCASGGNLIPMAASLPGATFVGVDRSPRQIAEARSLADAIELTNIEFRTLDILDIDSAIGRFDFIVCHGVFSWVSPDVQEAILTLCERNLSDNGVAVVSYNVLPGWHVKGLIRKMMVDGVRTSDAPEEQVRQARSILQRLGRDLTNRRDPYSRLLSDRVAMAANGSDTYLFHDYLEEVNEPVYLHQFVERAAAHGLRYLGDAKLRTSARAARDRVEREQYIDYIVNRSFRRSLLCHAEAQLDPAVAASSVLECHATAQARPVSAAPEIDSDRVEDFRGPDGKLWSTSHSLDKALLVSLAGRFPASLSFSRLSDEVGRLSGKPPDAQDLADRLLRSWRVDLVDLHRHPPQLPERISERPTASPLARIQARTSREVTNLRHRSVELDPVAQAMLCLLDGMHDRSALTTELRALAIREPSSVGSEDFQPRRPKRWREDIDGSLERMLRFFQRSALLVS
jgi:methyltransferase-like protein/predicted O-methyltransferase YrrM